MDPAEQPEAITPEVEQEVKNILMSKTGLLLRAYNLKITMTEMPGRVSGYGNSSFRYTTAPNPNERVNTIKLIMMELGVRDKLTTEAFEKLLKDCTHIICESERMENKTENKSDLET